MTAADLSQLALTTLGLAIGVAAGLYAVILGTVRVIAQRGGQR